MKNHSADQTLERQKMDSLRVMANGLAHEVNNPLSIISLKTQEIKSELSESHIDIEKIHLSATKIENMVTRISKIIQDTLAFARGTVGESLIIADLLKIVREAIDIDKDRSPQPRIPIQVQLPDLDELSLECRPNQLVEVMGHLLNNAQDAIRDLSDRWIKLEVKDGAEDVEIRVTDSGSGIQGPIQKKIFDPFFTTKGSGKGGGLGLSIAKTIVDLHLGELEFDTRQENTCFVVRLPKSQN